MTIPTNLYVRPSLTCVKQKCTHPLSDALTMYCLSLHALALDRQVMEAVWPKSMALGQIWAEDERESGGEQGIIQKTVTSKYKERHRTGNLTHHWHHRPPGGTSSSGVMSQRQICPSWQPVMMVLKSSMTSRLLMQWVGAVRPHSTMGRTKLFPDMMRMRLEGREQSTEKETQRDIVRVGGWSKWK